MSRRTISGVVALALLTAGIGVERARATIASYHGMAPCGKLTGMAGLLQAAHFVPKGNCRVSKDGSCADSAACDYASSVSGETTTGKCTTTTVGKVVGCACIAK